MSREQGDSTARRCPARTSPQLCKGPRSPSCPHCSYLQVPCLSCSRLPPGARPPLLSLLQRRRRSAGAWAVGLAAGASEGASWFVLGAGGSPGGSPEGASSWQFWAAGGQEEAALVSIAAAQPQPMAHV